MFDLQMKTHEKYKNNSFHSFAAQYNGTQFHNSVNFANKLEK